MSELQCTEDNIENGYRKSMLLNLNIGTCVDENNKKAVKVSQNVSFEKGNAVEEQE